MTARFRESSLWIQYDYKHLNLNLILLLIPALCRSESTYAHVNVRRDCRKDPSMTKKKQKTMPHLIRACTRRQ